MRKAHSNGTPRRGRRPAIASSLPCGERAGVVQQAADERGFAVVHVADDDDARGEVAAVCLTEGFIAGY